MNPPRVAYFPDSFHEVNGVALTSRQFDGFARRRCLPFLSVHGGPRNAVSTEGSVTTVELEPGAASFPLDDGFQFDLLFLRWWKTVREAVLQFKPDLVHVTSMGNFGLLGAMAAEEFHLPLVASWHTNVHEFGARRLEEMLWWAPKRVRQIASRSAHWQALRLAMRFYRRAKLLFAPNRDLIRLLARGTGKPVYPMWRGVDTELFDPARRRRMDSSFVLGFVGRIRPEKNVRFLAEVERRLRDAGVEDYRFVVVGQGSEREWLQANLRNVEFPGVLKGKKLARAYADMDVFVFPSQTDTFGNVVQEALASGVPAVVTRSGGPKYLVHDGETGYVTRIGDDFCERVVQLARDTKLQRRMAAAARQAMLDRSWDAVFESVYRAYPNCLATR